MDRIVLVTGGFDPLHRGHIAYFNEAKALGDILLVGVNSDEWLTRKKGKPFMSFEERLNIIQNLKCVHHAFGFNDDDGTAKDAIRVVRNENPTSKIIFANGGDRNYTNIPEMDYDDEKLEFVFGVGGDNKANSSSWILDAWKGPKTDRPWGYYRVVESYNQHVKLKELLVKPGQKLSMQRHFGRNEFWFVAQGVATVWTLHDTARVFCGRYKKTESLFIKVGEWHQLENEGTRDLKIIEVQYGDKCEEEDIERNVV
jgi:cytidyltransferase-like protein